MKQTSQSLQTGRARLRLGSTLFWAFWLAAALALVAPGCGSSDPPVPSTACGVDRDCTPPNVCALSRCRVECTSSLDCKGGGVCVTDNRRAVCQAAAERNTPCDKELDCPAPLACATDYRCRNLCATDADCNTLGVTGRLCARDSNDVLFCADPSEVRDGVLVAMAAPGNDGKGVQPPKHPLGGGGGASAGGASGGGASGMIGVTEAGQAGDSAGAGGDGESGGASAGAGTSGGGGMSSGGVSGGGASSGGVSGGGASSGGSSGSSGSGGGGGSAPVVCTTPCSVGKACVAGNCVPCGASGQACCDQQTCGLNLDCNATGTCSCGGPNQACCGGSACDTGLSCDTSASKHVCSCGALGAACCAGATSSDPPACLNSLACAGKKCTCIAELKLGVKDINGGDTWSVMRRSDKTVWKGTLRGAAFTQQLFLDNTVMLATSVAVGSNIGCAAVNGNAWCFPLSGTLADSTNLGAALGPTDSTSGPVKVVTSATGGALSGVKRVVAARVSGQDSFCAITDDASLWCWGRGNEGQLGHGDTTTSSFARKVLLNAGTPFADVVEVVAGAESLCARKTDGSVWCWGTNAAGELGVAPATLGHSYYPVQVTLLGTPAQHTATRLISAAYQTYCAIAQDTSVQCWGLNTFGQAGAAASATATPTQVLVAANGAPLTGVVDLTNSNSQDILAKTATLDLVFWGNKSNTASPYPNTLTDATNVAVSLVQGDLIGGLNNAYGPYCAYIDAVGRLTAVMAGGFGGVAPAQNQPPCSNLLPP